MIDINGETCYVSDVVAFDVGPGPDTVLTVYTYALPDLRFNIARGTKEEMQSLKDTIVSFMKADKKGYFDIPTRSWVETE